MDRQTDRQTDRKLSYKNKIKTSFLQSKKTAFSLAEMLLVMMLIGIASAALMPVITKNMNNSGFDSNVRNCIVNTNGDNSTAPCIAAIDSCKYGRENSCNTLKYFSDNANATYQTAALKILKDVCSLGGTKACDFFLQRCIGDGTKCYDTGNVTDLGYYMNLANSTTDASISHILTQGKSFYQNNLVNIKTNIDSTWCPGTCPAGSNVACAIKCSSGSGSGTTDYKTIIEGCNAGNDTQCQKGFNSSCANIYTICPTCANTTYKLTPKLLADAVTVNCSQNYIDCYGKPGTTCAYDNTTYIGTNPDGKSMFSRRTDQSAGTTWGPTSNTTSANSWWDGSYNQNVLTAISLTLTTYPASKVCKDLGADWYLPSLWELQQMYLYKNNIGGFSSVDYWSSTEYGGNDAWILGFGDGYLDGHGKGSSRRVRCLRKE